MSRIWKALKQAEKERSRSKERKHAGHSPADPHAHPDADKREHSLAHSQAHPHSDGADRRRSERWEQPVPVMVYGSDSGKPFTTARTRFRSSSAATTPPSWSPSIWALTL